MSRVRISAVDVDPNYITDWSVSDTAAMLTGVASGQLLDSSSSWIEEREALIAHVADHYQEISDQVLAYLRANSDLAWALIGAKGALRRAFGDSVVVRLAVVADVDAEDRRQELFAYVRAAIPLASASDALDQFDREWFLDRADILAGYLAFDLDF